MNLALPNRYRNNIIESEIQNEIKEAAHADKLNVIPQRFPDINPDVNQDRNNAQEVIDLPKVNENQLENQNIESNDIKVQENEPVIKDPVVQHIESKRKKMHVDVLGDKNEGLIKPPGQYEGEGDYDKDGHKEDLQIDEVEQEEGEEDGKKVIYVSI